jgi:hypothetical protein
VALKPACLSWLKDNPIVNPDCVKWLRSQEEKLYNSLLAAQAEAKEAERIRLQTANWGFKEWAQFHYCCVSDQARAAMAREQRTLTRVELDARNSDERPETADEVVARLFNDRTLVFWTPVCPNWHVDFSVSVELRAEDMAGGEITPEDVKKK